MPTKKKPPTKEVCCADVSIKCYKDSKDNDAPFLCFCCNKGKSQQKIAMLKNTVELLKLEISALKESLSAAHLKSPHQEGQPQHSYATAAGSGELSDKSTVQALHVTASGTSMPKS